ncbi:MULTISPECIES: LGFP repeat-containing protein [unclassified Modestobacter]
MHVLVRARIAAVFAAVVLLAAPTAAQAAVYPGPNGPQDVRGAIEAEWLRLGKAPGEPLTSEAPLANQGGAFTNFTRQAIYWSPNTGAHPVGGAFYQYWAARGWENSWLGYPASNEIPLNGGVLQRFQGGTLYWSPSTGAHTVVGEFYTLWDSLNWERGPLGYPASAPAPAAAGGTFQRFQYGAIYEPDVYRSIPDEPHSVSGAFYGYWAARGYERGRLGYPTSEENRSGGTVYQFFDGGVLYFSFCTGQVTETYPDYC